MADLIPHFDLPFKFAPNHHAATVQQDTEPDVLNCVSATVRTTRGTRYYVPWFGITDPTFDLEPLDVTELTYEVQQSEPRASLITKQTIKAIQDILQIQVGVDLSG